MVEFVSVWIAGGSLLVSAVALWRSGRVRVLDRRTELRTDIADLWPRLRELEATIPAAVKSRTNASSAIGLGNSGAVAGFRAGAEEDAETVHGLKARLDEIGRIPWLATYGRIEAKVVAARTVRTRFEQLAEKYAAAAREDESTRQHVRDHMTAVTAARLGRTGESSP